MNYYSPSFQIHFLPTYTLFVKTDYEQDSLMVVNEEEVVAFCRYPHHQPSEGALKLLTLPFEKVYVVAPQQSLLLTPDEVYSPEDKETYQQFLLESDTTRQETLRIEDYGVTASYEMDQWLVQKWSHVFPNATVVPSFEILLDKLHQYKDCDSMLGVHFNQRRIDVCLFMNGNLQIYNSFEFGDMNDLIFYMLHIRKSFSLSDRFSRMVLSQLSPEDPGVSKIRKYVDELVFLSNTLEIREAEHEVADSIKYSILLPENALCVL